MRKKEVHAICDYLLRVSVVYMKMSEFREKDAHYGEQNILNYFLQVE